MRLPERSCINDSYLHQEGCFDGSDITVDADVVGSCPEDEVSEGSGLLGDVISVVMNA